MIFYKIVMGFSMMKTLQNIDVYQIYNSCPLLISSYGMGHQCQEYLEMDIEDINSAFIIINLLLKKMDLQTPVSNVELGDKGFEIKDYIA